MSEIKEKEAVKPYEFRRLKSDDVFPMFKLLSKIGINEFKNAIDPTEILKITKAFQSEDGESKDSAFEAAGFTIILDVANVILEKIPTCKKEIYSLLADVSGMTEKEIADLDFVIFTEMIIDFVKKEEFKDFIEVVSRLFK